MPTLYREKRGLQSGFIDGNLCNCGFTGLTTETSGRLRTVRCATGTSVVLKHVAVAELRGKKDYVPYLNLLSARLKLLIPSL